MDEDADEDYLDQEETSKHSEDDRTGREAGSPERLGACWTTPNQASFNVDGRPRPYDCRRQNEGQAIFDEVLEGRGDGQLSNDISACGSQSLLKRYIRERRPESRGE